MPWQQPAGFEERTRSHHEETLRPVLQADQVFILTHATRGDIPGRTTHILQPLTQKHGLKEVTLLQPVDAPHGVNGYALNKCAKKAKTIAALLAPFKTELKSALSRGRMLVAGIFAFWILSFLGLAEEAAKWRIVHPCHWMNAPISTIHSKLVEVMGSRSPTLSKLRYYIYVAHSRSLRERWARMSHEDKAVYREFRRKIYAALPPDEKARRSTGVAERYAALPPEEKERRATGIAERYAALPPDEKERRSTACAERYAALPPEEKERRGKVSSIEGKKFWQGSLASYKIKRMQACHAWRASPEGKKTWKAALKVARASMDPVTRARCIALLRAGYASKMTPERRKEMRSRRKSGWTAEKREAARQRQSQRLLNPEYAEHTRANLQKAMAVRTENIEVSCAKTRVTCAANLIDRFRKIKQALEANPGQELSKVERRTFRERTQKFLDLHDAKTIVLDAPTIAALKDAKQFSLDSGAASKSVKLKRRFEIANALLPAFENNESRRVRRDVLRDLKKSATGKMPSRSAPKNPPSEFLDHLAAQSAAESEDAAVQHMMDASSGAPCGSSAPAAAIQQQAAVLAAVAETPKGSRKAPEPAIELTEEPASKTPETPCEEAPQSAPKPQKAPKTAGPLATMLSRRG